MTQNTMHPIKGVIFDMDGLMIDSERVTYEGYVDLLSQRNLDFDLETYKKCLGKPVAGIWQVFYDTYGNDFPIPEIMAANHQRIEDYFHTRGVPLKKGLIQLMEALKKMNIPMVVATSSDRKRVDDILQSADILHYFQDSICGDEVSCGKPDPEIFLKAAGKLKIPKENCLVLEDSEMGIEAASRAGIPVICIPDMKYPLKEYEKKTWKVLESLDQVIDLL